jgi:Ca-activated chloride channel homolog
MTPRPIHSASYAGNLMLAFVIAVALLGALPVLAFGQNSPAAQQPPAPAPASQPVQVDPAARAEAVYNQAVSAWQARQLDQAEQLFAEAISRGDESLAARARYNLGNCRYARALKLLENQQQPDTQGAIEQLNQAVTLYREALATNPADTDARANTELARKLIDQLKQQEKQQQQKKDQQKDQQKQDQKDQQSRDQKNQQQKQQDNQKKSQDRQDQQKQQQQQQNSEQKEKNKDQAEPKPQPQSQPDQQKQQQQKQQPKPSQSDQQPQPGQGQGQAGSARPNQEKPRQLSEQEAARLLQKIRDRHLRRRIEKFQQQKQYQPPVEKDW